MSKSEDDYNAIKRKIRNLKKLEKKIRFSNAPYGHPEQGSMMEPKTPALVWDEFFDLHDICIGGARYSLDRLSVMSKEDLKNVINEFFYHVYYRFYRENGILDSSLYDPDILAQMGLPIDADEQEIKRKFRELAKKYHPDAGGDSAKFIALMESYRKLTSSK